MLEMGMLAGRSPAEVDPFCLAVFNSADTRRNSALELQEFSAWYSRVNAPKLREALQEQHPEEVAELRAAFAKWGAFGSRAGQAPGLSAANWGKLCRETKLVSVAAGMASHDADLAFAKVKGKVANRINFDEVGTIHRALGFFDCFLSFFFSELLHPVQKKGEKGPSSDPGT
jgi:hypothetical protein